MKEQDKACREFSRIIFVKDCFSKARRPIDSFPLGACFGVFFHSLCALHRIKIIHKLAEIWMKYIFLWRKHNQWLLLSFSQQEKLCQCHLKCVRSLNGSGDAAALKHSARRWSQEHRQIKSTTQSCSLTDDGCHFACSSLLTSVTPSLHCTATHRKSNWITFEYDIKLKKDFRMCRFYSSLIGNECFLRCMYDICMQASAAAVFVSLLLWLWM